MRVSRLGYYAKNPSQILNRVLYALYSRQRMDGIANFLKVNAGTVVLASYPKSGNTLVRLLWLQILVEKAEIEGDADFNLLDDLLPNDQFLYDLRLRWNYQALPCLLKTHLPCLTVFRTQRSLHLVRNPLDAMVSNFKYFSARVEGPRGKKFGPIERRIFDALPQFTGTFSEFLREQFHNYCDHLTSWMEGETLPVSYERLVGEDDGPNEVGRIFGKLGLSVAPDMIVTAWQKTRAEKMKEKPAALSMAKLEGIHFVRDGRKGQWPLYFSKEDLLFVQESLRQRKLLSIEDFPERYRPVISLWPAECFPADAGSSFPFPCVDLFHSEL